MLCLIMLNYVTEYVWAIEYVGNLQVSDDELSDFLAQESIHYGMKKSSINCEEKAAGGFFECHMDFDLF